MRHRMKGRQFGRNSSHRKAMFRSLVTSLIEHEKIETTEAKAKEIRGIAERMITLGKRGDLHAKRMAMSFIRSRDVVAKLFTDVAGRVANREGGYTRIVKTRIRYGDSAPMAVLELVDKPGEVYKAPSKKKAAEKPKAETKAKKAKAKAAEEAAEETAAKTAEAAEAVEETAAEGATAEAPAEETAPEEKAAEGTPAEEAKAETPAEEVKAEAPAEEAVAPEAPAEEEGEKKE